MTNRMQTDASVSDRLLSLDVFRGISIGGMILVNNQGDWNHVYRALRHAAWHGWSGADVVFSFFLFALGASLFFSLSSRLNAGESKKMIFYNVVLRTFMLLALGLFLNCFPHFSMTQVRIPGVLQRIALCYFFSAALYLFISQGLRIIITAVLFFLYGALLLYVGPDGPGHGSLDPCCNLPGYIDKHLFPGHTYEPAPVPGFDPEGLASTVPALCSTMFGLFAAYSIRPGRPSPVRAAALMAAGTGFMAVGLILDEIIPINKNLWTPSYCVFMAGMAMLCFSFLHWAYDIRGFRRLSVPFQILGRNAIAVYLLSSLAGKALASISIDSGKGTLPVKTILYQTVSAAWLDPRASSLIYAVGFLSVWLGIMYILYRRRIFISI